MSSALSAPAPAAHDFFAAYPALWQQLRPGIRLRTLHKGDSVLCHGDAANALWLVQKGWVKLVRQTPDGKETVVGICTEGDLFGEAALFPHASYPYNAEVLEDQTELYAIPADALRALLQDNPSFSSGVMRMLNERIANTQLKLEHMSTMSTAQRLGCFLLRLCKTQGPSHTLKIPVEKHVLAAYLGMKPETFSRSLQQLKTAEVEVSGAEVKVKNTGALREFVCHSCSESGSCETDELDAE